MSDTHDQQSALTALGATELRERLADGRVTSVALVTVLLERIETIDSPSSTIALRSMAAVASDALAVAQERDDERARGEVRGPLHGLPVVIKDSIEALGLPGLSGSSALVGRPSRDAELVTRLRDAGAIVLGSTNLSQWANIRSSRSSSGWSATGGLVGNPWALDRSAGGSSSGSGAAVAAGLSPLAVGTETDGSIVCPASVNGIVGLKPTVGVVPTTHVMPISPSQDSPGPMARSVDDVALLFSVLAQQEPQTVTRPLRFGVATNWRTGDATTDQRFDDFVARLESRGFEVTRRDVALPDTQAFEDELTVLLAELHDALGDYLAQRPGDGVHSLADVVAYEDAHAEIEQPYFGHDFFVRAVSLGGRAHPSYAPARERNLRWAVETCLTPALQDVDMLLAPAYGPSWKSDLVVGGHPGPASPATMAPAIAGWPIMSLPLGLVHGLPVGLALLGRAHDEWTLLEGARQLEKEIAEFAPLPAPTFRAPERG